MADHGAILTKFEELFGSVVEHEVIKMVLQNYEWNPKVAIEKILEIINPEDLTPELVTLIDEVCKESTEVENFKEKIGLLVSKPNEEDSLSFSLKNTNENVASSQSSVATVYNNINSNVDSGAVDTFLTESAFNCTARISPSRITSASSNNINIFNNESNINPPKIDNFIDDESVLAEFSGVAVPKTGKNINFKEEPSFLCKRQTSSEGSVNILVPTTCISEKENIPAFVSPTAKACGTAPTDVNVDLTTGVPKMSNNEIYNSHSKKFQNSDVKIRNDEKPISKEEEIQNVISEGKKLMVIMRGLPGSGKTTLANKLMRAGGVVLSADDYFLDRQGVYRYDREKIGSAHDWNQRRTLKHIAKGKTPIFIDNTNLQAWEVKPYVKVALKNSYRIELLEPQTSWKSNPNILSKTTLHFVPREKIIQMKENTQEYTMENVIKNMTKDNPSLLNKSTENITLENDPSPTDVDLIDFTANDRKEASKSCLESASLPISLMNTYAKSDDSFYKNDEERCDDLLNEYKGSPDVIIEDIYLFDQENRATNNLANRDFISVKNKELVDCGVEKNDLTNKGYCDTNLKRSINKSINLDEDYSLLSSTASSVLSESDASGNLDWNVENSSPSRPIIKTNDQRSSRKRNGNPDKWMHCEEKDNIFVDPIIEMWKPSINSHAGSSWINTPDDNLNKNTGAVPKQRRNVHHTPDRQQSPAKPEDQIMAKKNASSQTLLGEIMDKDNKVIYGCSDRVVLGNNSCQPPLNIALTQNKLMLEKGSMTDAVVKSKLVNPIHNLVALFPKIPKEQLGDVLEKCQNDLDWATNVLLDGGYEMSNSTNLDLASDEEQQSVGSSDCSSGDDCLVENNSAFINKVNNKKIRQSTAEEALKQKKEIENMFQLTDASDDRMKRLTGKEVTNVSVYKEKQKVKKSKSKKGKIKSEKNTNDSKNETQYLTLALDPLFALHLKQMYGPVGSFDTSGEFSAEERNVVLPLDLCKQIHKFWSSTAQGKFQAEAAILDLLVKEDAELAKSLQEEEEEKVKLDSYDSTTATASSFGADPPIHLEEIMALETALQASKEETKKYVTQTVSSIISLQQLCKDFSYIDKNAVKEEYFNCNENHNDTVVKLISKYGISSDMPKTVVANSDRSFTVSEQKELNVMKDYEEQEQKWRENIQKQWEEEEISPSDLQAYRDEAVMHYQQRKMYFIQAQQSASKGMKEVASYYARMGTIHAEKMEQANQRASFKILEAQNAKLGANQLDLHLLHVPEALNATRSFIAERYNVLCNRKIDEAKVTIITGRGVHSKHGHARLKPAVENFLRTSGYQYVILNGGSFEVNLKRNALNS